MTNNQLEKLLTSVEIEFEVRDLDATIYSPKVIDIYDENNRYRTQNFINCFKYITFLAGKRLHISFEKLEEMTAAASVILFAEITSNQLIFDEPNIITFTQPLNKKAKKIFSEYDFYKAIKPGTYKKVESLLNENCFFQSGTIPVKHAKSAIEALKKSGLEVIKSEANIFQASILEAMSNVRHHSYRTETPEELQRWWQFAHFSQANSCLRFVVYDRGLGIPKTIEKLCVNGENDGQKIELALKLGVTSKVGEPGRGKGSREILKTYVQNDNSSLLIYSGKGLYFQDKDGGIKIVDELKHPIKGTIIEWQIPYKAG